MDGWQATALVLLLDATAAEVIATFHARRIAAIVLKGPSFARWLYDDGAARTYGDIDLLVSLSDCDAARQALRSIGFDAATAGMSMSELAPFEEAWVRGPAVIDLHHSLLGIGVDPERAWAILAADTESMSLAGQAVTVLSEPGRALHVTLHAAANGRRGRKSLEDLDRAVQRLGTDTWQRAADLARRLRADGAMHAGLVLHPDGAALASSLGLTRAVPIEFILAERQPPPSSIGLARLLATRGTAAKLARLGRACIPTPAYLRAWTPLVRRGLPGLALAYVWRLVCLAGRLPSAAVAVGAAQARRHRTAG